MKAILISFSVLALVCIVAFLFLPKTRKFIAIGSRLFVGIIFIFSGFVKLIDPLGTNYKFIDYFETMNLELLIPYALPLAITMCVAEFLIGFALFFSAKIRLSSWAVLLFMGFFTPLTLWLAISNPVPDCGCFGDAIKLTNWETFWKNIVIDVFVVLVFITYDRIKFGFCNVVQWIIISVGLTAGYSMSLYSYYHLPLMDFMTWHVGNRLAPENPLPVEYYITYKNKKSGEQKEYKSQDIPTDSLFSVNWEWVTTNIKDPNIIKDHGLTIADESSNVVTDNFVKNKDYQFILISYDLAKGNWEKMNALKALIDSTYKKEYSFILITSTEPFTAKKFVKDNGLLVDVYYADDTSLKAVIRANPGLVLLKNALVLGKWNINDLPSINDLRKQFKDMK